MEAGAAISVPDANQGGRMTEEEIEFKPYVEAARIDKKLEQVEKRFPITKDNLHLWTLFHRTVQSTLMLIEKQLEKVSKDATP